MRKSIRIIAIIVILSIVFSLTGCFMIDTDDKYGKNVLRCFDENDNEGLKKMFCNYVLSSPNIDNQIQEVMDFFDGTTVSHGNISTPRGEAIVGGKVTDSHMNTHITGIETDAGKKYEIWFHTYFVYVENGSMVGISRFSISSDSGEKIIIGSFL